MSDGATAVVKIVISAVIVWIGVKSAGDAYSPGDFFGRLAITALAVVPVWAWL